jgi:uncharacterized protein YgiM (DUF1202 family)
MHHDRNVMKVAFLGFLVLALVASACNMSSNSNSAALTVTAAMSNLTETAKAAPTNTSVPPPTQPPQPTIEVPQPVTSPAQPVATEPPVVEGPTAISLENTNCRMGADPGYEITGAFVKNAESRIIGKNENGSWWLIEDPSKEGQNCWVWGQTTQVRGDTSAVPYVPSPPLSDGMDLTYPEPDDDLIPLP